ncbi:hypothetical protein ISS85_03710 [Candidatus Microgenomates bacterium]|nr:hypothetical protein [Candidatus Microgenomates bacterium]
MNFKIINGYFPVLLSAPHAAPHVRPEFDIKNPKLNEPNTDLIVEVLCEKTGCFGIYTTKVQKVDPNWYKNSPYKKTLQKLVKRNCIKFILDIHGAKKEKPFILEYKDFQKEKGLKGVEKNLLRCFKKFGFCKKEIIRGHRQKKEQMTIAEFCVKELKIPALQLEINRKIREPENPRFKSLLSALECFLKTF